MSLENMKKFIFDIEIYPNYFCVVIKEFEKNKGVIKHISGDINPADLGFHK